MHVILYSEIHLDVASNMQGAYKLSEYFMRINYRWILLCHNLSRKCRKIVKFVSVTYSERTFGMVL